MARIITLVLTLFLLSLWNISPTFAKSPPPENCEQRPYDSGRLWQISKKGLPTSFVFGTMHSKDPRILFLPGIVMQAFTGSTIFVLETSLRDKTIVESQAAMFGGQEYSLRAEIGDAQFGQLAKLTARYGIADQFLDKFKIWAAASVISQPPQPKNSNDPSLTLLDRELEKSAFKMQKSIVPLETMQEQLSVFDQMPKNLQLEFLDQTMKEHTSLDEEIERLSSHYLAGKTGWIFCDLEETLKQVSPGLASVMTDKLIKERNAKMVERMIPSILKGRSFIAIGALHLPGEKGVLSLLNSKGFQIKRKF